MNVGGGADDAVPSSPSPTPWPAWTTTCSWTSTRMRTTLSIDSNAWQMSRIISTPLALAETTTFATAVVLVAEVPWGRTMEMLGDDNNACRDAILVPFANTPSANHSNCTMRLLPRWRHFSTVMMMLMMLMMLVISKDLLDYYR